MRTTSSIGSKSRNTKDLDINIDFWTSTGKIIDQLIEITDRHALDESRRLLRALQGLKKRNSLRQFKLAIFSDSESAKADLIRKLIQTTPADEKVPRGLPASVSLAYGAESECAVTLSNGFNVRLPLPDLGRFVHELEKDSSLTRVVARIPNQALRGGLVVVDTPDLSGDRSLWLATIQTAEEADACVLVTSGEATPGALTEPASVFLRSLHHSVGSSVAKFFIVRNLPENLNNHEQGDPKISSAELEEHGVQSSRIFDLYLSRPEQGFDARHLAAFETELFLFARLNSQASLAAHLNSMTSEALIQARRVLSLRSGLLHQAKLRRAISALTHLCEDCDRLLASTEAARGVPEERPSPTQRKVPPVEANESPGLPESAPPESVLPDAQAAKAVEPIALAPRISEAPIIESLPAHAQSPLNPSIADKEELGVARTSEPELAAPELLTDGPAAGFKSPIFAQNGDSSAFDSENFNINDFLISLRGISDLIASSSSAENQAEERETVLQFPHNAPVFLKKKEFSQGQRFLNEDKFKLEPPQTEPAESAEVEPWISLEPASFPATVKWLQDSSREAQSIHKPDSESGQPSKVASALVSISKKELSSDLIQNITPEAFDLSGPVTQAEVKSEASPPVEESKAAQAEVQSELRSDTKPAIDSPTLVPISCGVAEPPKPRKIAPFSSISHTHSTAGSFARASFTSGTHLAPQLPQPITRDVPSDKTQSRLTENSKSLSSAGLSMVDKLPQPAEVSSLPVEQAPTSNRLPDLEPAPFSSEISAEWRGLSNYGAYSQNAADDSIPRSTLARQAAQFAWRIGAVFLVAVSAWALAVGVRDHMATAADQNFGQAAVPPALPTASQTRRHNQTQLGKQAAKSTSGALASADAPSAEPSRDAPSARPLPVGDEPNIRPGFKIDANNEPAPAASLVDAEASESSGVSHPPGTQTTVPLSQLRTVHGAEADANDPSLQTALDRWVSSYKSGNINAQVNCYAPFVDNYFNWHNARPEQVRRDKVGEWSKIASLHEYKVTPLSVTDQGNGQKAVLLQKDWDSTTTRGTTFSGSEIEKLVFVKIDDSWKIVDEQEMKVLKLRRG